MKYGIICATFGKDRMILKFGVLVMSGIDYDKKIARCERLGSKKFMKLVEKVEKVKFKVLKKVFPGYLKRYDKRMDKALEKELKRVKTEEERKELIRSFQRQKMLIRKEHNFEQNRNYHMDANNPSAFVEYLKWNKQIHVQGLIVNGISSVAIAVTGIFVPAVLPLLALEAVDAFINFQCINNQNKGIYRYERDKERIEAIADRKREKNIKKYGEIAKVIDKALEKQETAKLPETKEVTSTIRTKEELFQAMALAVEELKARGLTERAEALNQKKLEAMNKYETKVSGEKVKKL